MRLLVGTAMVMALAVGTLSHVKQASAEQAAPRIEQSDKADATDVSARHRRYHHGYRRYSHATLPYDGYRPYPPPPPCYGYCPRDLNLLPYFGRGW